MNQRLPAVIVLCGLAFLGAAGCTKHAPTVQPKVVLQRNVDLATVQQKALVARIETIGVLEAEGQTDIAAGVSGVVDQVFFREGDEVETGGLLITIDQERFQADEDLAKANMERAKENLALMRDLNARAEKAGTAISAEDRSKAFGNFRVADAEFRSATAAHVRAKTNLKRSQVRAPYAGRINKRMVTVGSYLEEKTILATIADLSRLRLVGYVAESAAPIMRDLLATQDDRLDASRLCLALAGATAQTPLERLLPWGALYTDMVPSGYDPEFEVFALPGQKYHARIFYMSTVGSMDTHMFECKAEVLGWKFHQLGPKTTGKFAPSLVNEKGEKALALPRPSARSLEMFNAPKLWPGFTAKVRFPLRTSPLAAVIPEEAYRHTEKGYVVFVPEERRRNDGTADWVARARVIDVGIRGEGWVEVRRGLSVGERIVHRGAEALEDGTPIKLKLQTN